MKEVLAASPLSLTVLSPSSAFPPLPSPSSHHSTSLLPVAALQAQIGKPPIAILQFLPTLSSASLSLALEVHNVVSCFVAAGIVGADTGNGVGVAGTAGGSKSSAGVSLMHLTVFGNTGTGGFAKVQAVRARAPSSLPAFST
eukprot:6190094-Pleurochrysis_carterae.AAC.6